jgi:DNA-binding NtrC family response regulator
MGNKIGLVEIADGGTLFLDEIGDLPLDVQVKFLRLLQEREFRPVGSLLPQAVDVRFIAATNRDLAADVQAGRFRLDLYQRLNVFPIQLPPLRERRGDIRLLAEHFLAELEGMGLGSAGLDRHQLEALEGYDWPGNVRELKHFVERMVALGLDSQTDVRSLLSPTGPTNAFRDRPSAVRASTEEKPAVGEPMSIAEGELHLIGMALAATSGNRAKAAEILRISRTTLYRRLRNAPRASREAAIANRATRYSGGEPSSACGNHAIWK